MKEALLKIMKALREFYGLIKGGCSEEESAYWLNEGICEKVKVQGFLMVGPGVLTYPEAKSYCLRK